MYGEVVARLDCYIGIRMHAEVIEMHAIGYRYRYYIVLLAVIMKTSCMLLFIHGLLSVSMWSDLIGHI